MKINDNVLAVLADIAYDGNKVRIEQQLERTLYVQVNKVLEAAGGKWNRGAKAHIFPGDAGDALEQIVLSGEVTVPQDFGFFPTPVAIVTKLLDAANTHHEHLLLEPSAGTGNIAVPLSRRACLHAIELLPANIKVLRDKLLDGKKFGCDCRVTEADFLKLKPDPIYDRVVMNPPFGKRADIHHVNHALKWLSPGGRLVSVMSAGVTFREDKLTRDFRQFIEDHGTIEPLPDDAFKESGTSVRTVMVVLDK